MRSKYEILEHTADLKIKAKGKSVAEVFKCSAEGMMNFLFGEIKIDVRTSLRDVSTETIESSGENYETLLVNWLSDLLTLSDTKHVFCFDFEILDLSAKKIRSRLKFISSRPVDDIKAVTYHGLKISEVDGRFEVAVLYDV